MTSRHSVSILIILLTAGAGSGLVAQKPASAKMPQHQDSTKAMKGMKGMHGTGMSGMMGGPHQVLAMAYRDNIATFGRALRGHLASSPTVNLDLARPAVAEMRRSFDQMKEHHQAQMMMMDNAKPAMSEPMQHMEAHLTAVGEHLTALESELNTGTPSPARAAEHTNMILKECAGMSSMPAKKAKPQ